MELGLRGRTAIVCGASSGLGLASAEALAAEGANVAMFARRRDVLERDADRIGALVVRGDVTNAADLERLVTKTVEAFGGIDILVWNSGGPPAGPASEITDSSSNPRSSFCCSRRCGSYVWPCRTSRERGRPYRLHHLDHRQGADAPPGTLERDPPGARGWAKTLARELGPKAITVNCVAPGRIDTPRMTELYGPDGPPAEELAQIPLGRLGSPAEFGDVVCFVASARAAYITGTTVLVDGGNSRGLL